MQEKGDWAPHFRLSSPTPPLAPIPCEGGGPLHSLGKTKGTPSAAPVTETSPQLSCCSSITLSYSIVSSPLGRFQFSHLDKRQLGLGGLLVVQILTCLGWSSGCSLPPHPKPTNLVPLHSDPRAPGMPSGHWTIEPLLVAMAPGWGGQGGSVLCLPRARLPLLPHIPSLSLSYSMKAN